MIIMVHYLPSYLPGAGNRRSADMSLKMLRAYRHNETQNTHRTRVFAITYYRMEQAGFRKLSDPRISDFSRQSSR